MESKTNQGIFTDDHLKHSFYPSEGKIHFSKVHSFDLDKGKIENTLKIQPSLPLYIYFGDLAINCSPPKILSQSI